jgi:hypothetical protein
MTDLPKLNVIRKLACAKQHRGATVQLAKCKPRFRFNGSLRSMSVLSSRDSDETYNSTSIRAGRHFLFESCKDGISQLLYTNRRNCATRRVNRGGHIVSVFTDNW